jgi:hypothetical protein
MTLTIVGWRQHKRIVQFGDDLRIVRDRPAKARGLKAALEPGERIVPVQVLHDLRHRRRRAAVGEREDLELKCGEVVELHGTSAATGVSDF